MFPGIWQLFELPTFLKSNQQGKKDLVFIMNKIQSLFFFFSKEVNTELCYRSELPLMGNVDGPCLYGYLPCIGRDRHYNHTNVCIP